jgi:hypothetical protein
MKRILGAVGLLGIVFVAGCNNCEKLAEAICKDLGDDCAEWKALGGPDTVTPGGRNSNKACGLQLDNEISVKSFVIAGRGRVLGARLEKAEASGDKAKAEAIRAAIEKNANESKALSAR